MEKRRFIMIGFDGANPEFIDRYLPHLPNFRRLIEGGSWGGLLSTVPADTPTNWTALVTGATAATSGITGFAYYEPGTSLTEAPKPATDYDRMRNAEFLWEAADRQGKTSILVNYPFSWWSKGKLERTVIVGGDQIGGGICQIVARGCICTPDRVEDLRGARPMPLRPEDDAFVGDITFSDVLGSTWTAGGLEWTETEGPKETKISAHVRSVPGSPGVVEFQGVDGKTLAKAAPGEWTPFVCLPVGDEEGWVRFFVGDQSADGASLQLFHTMVTRKEGWTKPAKYAAELVDAVGPYLQGSETAGGADRNGWFGEYGMEADMNVLLKSGELLTGFAKHLMAQRPDWDHAYIQLHSSDGLNHRHLGHLDPSHPRTTPELTAKVERWYLESYKATDVILGVVAALAEEVGAVLAVVSDHSAVPTHTWVDVVRPFEERGWVNWDETGWWDPTRSKVRNMDNHSFHINLRGRQPDGIVEMEEYEFLRDEIITTLMLLRDPRTGECPIAVAGRREDMASIGCDGPYFGDVVYMMRPGYTHQPAAQECKNTKESMLKFIDKPEEALETGWALHWSIQGNHHDYLPNANYPGVCSNRAILLLNGPGIRAGHRIKYARTIDVAPTLAALMGIEPPAQSEGLVVYDALDPEAL